MSPHWPRSLRRASPGVRSVTSACCAATNARVPRRHRRHHAREVALHRGLHPALVRRAACFDRRCHGVPPPPAPAAPAVSAAPAAPQPSAEPPPAALEALSIQPKNVVCHRRKDGSDGNFLIELESEAAVRNVTPDFSLLRKAANAGFIITARGGSSGYDFVSRYFACYAGIDEDPVTGSAHCMLTPYWAKVLGKTEMKAYQASARGGEVNVRLAGDRVFLAGEAVTVLRGSLLC